MQNMYSTFEIVNNDTHKYLHIIPTNILPNSNEFYALCTMSRAYDYNFNEFNEIYFDFEQLNNHYNSIWLSVEPAFYLEKQLWIEQAEEKFNGDILNLYLNPYCINNVVFAYDVRVGYNKGELTYLSGSYPITEETDEFIRNFASINHLDVGVVNFYNGEFTISTYWEINVTKTEAEAIASAKFINSIFKTLDAPQYWNHVNPEDITICSNYMESMYHLDLSYEDGSKTNTLIVHDENNLLKTQLECIVNCKDLSSISFCDGSELENIELNEYDNILFIVDDHFPYRYEWELQRIRQEYKGKLINFDCLNYITRDKVFDAWLNAKIPCPKYLPIFGFNVPEKEDIPFDLPYVLRTVKGHSGRSNMVLTYDYDYVSKYPWWIWSSSCADFMVQEYVDVSINGTWDCGRLIWVYDKIFPLYALCDSVWECRPSRTTVKYRTVGKDCFNFLIRGIDKIKDFKRQVNKIIRATKIDIGALDFSIKDGKVIPWDVTIKWGNGLIRHSEDLSSETLTDIFNSIFKKIKNPLRVEKEEMKILLKEAEMEARTWNRDQRTL